MATDSSINTGSASEPAAVKASDLTALDKFKVGRSYIEHENTLMGQRVTWFLTLQGLLFTAFFLVAQIPWEKGSACYRGLTLVAVAGAFAVGALGIASSWLIWMILRIALVEIDDVTNWWRGQKADGLPTRITGEGSAINAHHFALVFVCVWTVLLTAFWYSMRHEFSPTWAWATSDRPTPIAICKVLEKPPSCTCK